MAAQACGPPRPDSAEAGLAEASISVQGERAGERGPRRGRGIISIDPSDRLKPNFPTVQGERAGAILPFSPTAAATPPLRDLCLIPMPSPACHCGSTSPWRCPCLTFSPFPQSFLFNPKAERSLSLWFNRSLAASDPRLGEKVCGWVQEAQPAGHSRDRIDRQQSIKWLKNIRPTVLQPFD